MRILFIYQFCSLGGCETVLRNRLVGFRALGLAPRVVLLHDVGGGEIFAGFPDVKYPCTLDELARIARDGHYDVVSVIDTPQAYPALEHAWLDTLVTEVHSNRVENLQYLHELHRTGTDVVVTPSRYEIELIHREFPALRDGPIPLRVVPNPVDTELFRLAEPAVSPRRKLLGWVGRLEPEKNWRHFLDVAAALARTRDDVGFLVVGGWAVTDGVKQEFLEAVKERELVDRLDWVSSLPYERMPRFYSLLAASGGCLLPTSVVEPFGMSLIEAMACGCPVVASRAGAFEELIEHGRSGLTFEVNDTAQAVAAVSAVLDDPLLRERLVASARAQVEERWAPRAVAKRYLAVVREAAGPAVLQAAP